MQKDENINLEVTKRAFYFKGTPFFSICNFQKLMLVLLQHNKQNHSRLKYCPLLNGHT